MSQLRLELSIGMIGIELYEQRAPLTCAYFTDLAASAAYSQGHAFRITDAKNQIGQPAPIHVVQFGLAQALNAERTTVAHESTAQTGLTHNRWAVSAARFSPGQLYGSFFVCMRDEKELDFGGRRHDDGQGFAVFGKVSSGHEVLKAIHEQSEPDENLANPIALHSASIDRDSET